MINDTVEVDEITRDVVLARMREFLGKDFASPDNDLNAVADALIVFMALDPDNGGWRSSDRALFIRGIGALVCGECGKASCLCGYPDT